MKIFFPIYPNITSSIFNSQIIHKYIIYSNKSNHTRSTIKTPPICKITNNSSNLQIPPFLTTGVNKNYKKLLPPPPSQTIRFNHPSFLPSAQIEAHTVRRRGPVLRSADRADPLRRFQPTIAIIRWITIPGGPPLINITGDDSFAIDRKIRGGRHRGHRRVRFRHPPPPPPPSPASARARVDRVVCPCVEERVRCRGVGEGERVRNLSGDSRETGINGQLHKYNVWRHFNDARDTCDWLLIASVCYPDRGGW